MTTQPNPNPPFCINCSAYNPPDESKKEEVARCGKFSMLDLVNGQIFLVPCHHLRSPEAPCAEEGRLFTPKESVPSSN